MDVPGPTMDRNFECGGHPAPVFWDNGATSSCSKPIIATTNALEAVVRWYAACPYSLPAQRACCSHARPNWQLALLCMEQDSVADHQPCVSVSLTTDSERPTAVLTAAIWVTTNAVRAGCSLRGCRHAVWRSSRPQLGRCRSALCLFWRYLQVRFLITSIR